MFIAVNRTAARIGGVTGSGGFYRDRVTAESGSFGTVGGTLGLDVSGGISVGFINGSANEFAGPSIVAEADLPSPVAIGLGATSITGLSCGDGRCYLNGVFGYSLGVEVGAGAAISLAWTWTTPSQQTVKE